MSPVLSAVSYVQWTSIILTTKATASQSTQLLMYREKKKKKRKKQCILLSCLGKNNTFFNLPDNVLNNQYLDGCESTASSRDIRAIETRGGKKTK